MSPQRPPHNYRGVSHQPDREGPGTVARLSRPIDAGAPIGRLLAKWAVEHIDADKPASSVDKLTAWLDPYMRSQPVEDDLHTALATDVKAAAEAQGFSKSNVRDHIVPSLRGLGGEAGPRPGQLGAAHVYALPVNTSGSEPSLGSLGGTW